MKALGKHLILELYGCPAESLNDPVLVENSLTAAVKASGATLIKPFFHQFAPQGVSGVIIIAESHFTIHTWPEYNYAAVDVFTCGEVIDMDAAVEVIRTELNAQSLQKMGIDRGMLDIPEHRLRHKPEELTGRCGHAV